MRLVHLADKHVYRVRVEHIQIVGIVRTLRAAARFFDRANAYRFSVIRKAQKVALYAICYIRRDLRMVAVHFHGEHAEYFVLHLFIALGI